MSDVVAQTAMFQCDKGGMHKLVVIMSPATGDSQSLAANGNCLLVPQGTPCSLLYGAPCPMVVSIVSKEGQSTVEVGGAKALGAGCEFMCPMGGKLTAQSNGQAIAKHNEASAGLQIASLVVDLIPFVGTIKSIVEVVTGVDPITGEATSRLAAAAGIVPGGKAVTKGGKVIKAIVKGEKGAVKAAKAANAAAKTEKVAASSSKAASKGEKAAAKNAPAPKAANETPKAANENNYHPKAANENNSKAANDNHPPPKPANDNKRPNGGTVDPNLPKNPANDPHFEDVSHPKAAENGHYMYKDKRTGEIVRFDKAKPNGSGHKAHDHYHRENPNSTGKMDAYLDAHGNPVADGSPASHIYSGQNN